MGSTLFQNANLFEQLLILSIFIPITIVFTFILYRTKIKKDPVYNQSFKSLLNSRHKQFLRTLYGKLVMGLNTYGLSLLSQENQEILELVKNVSTTSQNTTIITNLYPEQIREEMTSSIRGRSVLILVELAYQSQKNAYPSYISKALNIPPQTVTFELKRLLELEYIKQIQTATTLQDTRYKYYDLTAKGIMFLHLLKETIAYSLVLVQTQDIKKE